MTWFILIAAAMVVGALAWVLPALLARHAREEGVSRTRANLAILRDQLAELDADVTRGTMDRAEYERARAELEHRVLEEGEGDPEPAAAPAAHGRWGAGVVGVLIPVAAVLLYLLVGTPESLSPQGQDAGVTSEQIEQMVTRLARRLEADPDDPEGWALLARSYYVMGRFGQAAAAYERAVRLKDGDAGLYADYADALAMSEGRHIGDKGLALVERALRLDPEHPKALIMAGTAALDRGDYRGAVQYLERLQRFAPAGSELSRMIDERLQQARAALGEKGKPGAAASAGGATVSGRVALSAPLAGKAAPTDTVFILARAAEGPRMPLAILKRQVRDLPYEFALTDEQAMSPEMKLSRFTEVVVVARISKSGGATPQSGDLQGATRAVKVGAKNVSVVIDTVVP